VFWRAKASFFAPLLAKYYGYGVNRQQFFAGFAGYTAVQGNWIQASNPDVAKGENAGWDRFQQQRPHKPGQVVRQERNMPGRVPA
jgi:hypothetical protein